MLITGCLAQRYCDELLRQIPEIDGMLGIDQYDKIGELLDHDASFVAPPHSSYHEFEAPVALDQRPYAYLKIADGCDSGCSYCAIPRIRGRYRSRSLAAISRDLDRYLSAGALEINLIAQDAARYGFDIGKSPLNLLEMIENRRENFWLRPFYLHPSNVTAEIIDFLGASRKFCHYLEIPVQHASSRLLDKMNRGYDEKYVRDLFTRLRKHLPETVIRTTFIVGFPGETNADFETLMNFVEDFEICRGGVFVYSREESTAAYHMGRRPAASRVRSRQEALENLINANADSFNQSLIGGMHDMLVEKLDADRKRVWGRLFCDAPQIDFQVCVDSPRPIGGSFLPVRITDVDSCGFVGKPVLEEVQC